MVRLSKDLKKHSHDILKNSILDEISHIFMINNCTYFPFVSLVVFELLRLLIPGNIRLVIGSPFSSTALTCLKRVT